MHPRPSWEAGRISQVPHAQGRFQATSAIAACVLTVLLASFGPFVGSAAADGG
ncbi:MAG: hypothetical protein ACYDDF_08645 [Thermoplasmatota archaeon]